jgi:hypothetical protein
MNLSPLQMRFKLKPNFVLKFVDTIDVDIQDLGNPELGLNSMGIADLRRHAAQLQVLSDLGHNDRIGYFGNRQI